MTGSGNCPSIRSSFANTLSMALVMPDPNGLWLCDPAYQRNRPVPGVCWQSRFGRTCFPPSHPVPTPVLPNCRSYRPPRLAEGFTHEGLDFPQRFETDVHSPSDSPEPRPERPAPGWDVEE